MLLFIIIPINLILPWLMSVQHPTTRLTPMNCRIIIIMHSFLCYFSKGMHSPSHENKTKVSVIYKICFTHCALKNNHHKHTLTGIHTHTHTHTHISRTASRDEIWDITWKMTGQMMWLCKGVFHTDSAQKIEVSDEECGWGVGLDMFRSYHLSVAELLLKKIYTDIHTYTIHRAV